MDDYSFAADLLATFRASPDFIKALWLIIPPGFVLGLMGLLLRWREGGRGRRFRLRVGLRQPAANMLSFSRWQEGGHGLLSHEELSGISRVQPIQPPRLPEE